MRCQFDEAEDGRRVDGIFAEAAHIAAPEHEVAKAFSKGLRRTWAGRCSCAPLAAVDHMKEGARDAAAARSPFGHRRAVGIESFDEGIVRDGEDGRIVEFVPEDACTCVAELQLWPRTASRKPRCSLRLAYDVSRPRRPAMAWRVPSLSSRPWPRTMYPPHSPWIGSRRVAASASPALKRPAEARVPAWSSDSRRQPYRIGCGIGGFVARGENGKISAPALRQASMRCGYVNAKA